ncbi:hypothetical protein LLEC1_02726 [Akanthomyces lecanii]|uniref:Alpha-1,3-mannosyltransferase n=1 Tax=Cordyceps confragosa TaxID=2714763 RepID=A0A179IAK9_CORDF|nr:hypothetical protein LLEC1_02726 [Akanthomyces lecanii]
MSVLGSFRRLSPSREFGKFGRQRLAIRFVKLLLISFFVLCLFYLYFDRTDQTADLSDDSSDAQAAETAIHRNQLENASGGSISPSSVPPSQVQEKVAPSRNIEFELALRAVEDLLPGEMETRWMLHAIEGTGPEKLREIGLRAREYKKFFQAWEKLHLVEGGPEATFIRSDMVPYMRRYFSKTAGKLADTRIERSIKSYGKYKALMSRFEQLMAGWTAPYFADHMTLHLNLKYGGRGIVVTAGNNQVPHLKTLVHSLRDVGCTLPIEVMYVDDQDLGVDVQAELAALDGVTTRELAPMVDDKGWKLAGWAVKAYAIMYSSFREAIFIDADSFFFKDPATLFEDEDYQRTGALFFKDRVMWHEWKQDWLKKVLPKPISSKVQASRYWKGESGHMQESGVVVVDKWRHFIAMLVVCRMNGPERNGNKDLGTVGVYDMVYGDKETFWLGWELVGDTDYAFHGGRVAVMGVAEEADADKPPAEELKRSGLATEPNTELSVAYTVCAPQLLHLGVDGNPLWFNGGLLQNKFVDKKEWEFGKFQEFVTEPEKTSATTWKLLGSNMACLTGEASSKHALSTSESEAVQRMIEQAKKFL